MVEIKKFNGLTVPGGSDGASISNTQDPTVYAANNTAHSAGTIPTWTTRITHTLSDSYAYISRFWNSSSSTAYTGAFYFKIILNSTTVIDSYTVEGTTYGRCWPEPYTGNDQWMVIGPSAWLMFTCPMWSGGTIQIQTSPLLPTTTHYLSYECHIVDMDIG